MHGCWQECGRMSAITCSCHWHTSVVYSSSFLDLPGQPCNFFFTLNDGECKKKKKSCMAIQEDLGMNCYILHNQQYGNWCMGAGKSIHNCILRGLMLFKIFLNQQLRMRMVEK